MDVATVDIIINFLTDVGIPVVECSITAPAFLGGLQMENGKLVIDREKLLYPGDILHEAGHLATMPPEIRETMCGTLPKNDLNMGGEIMALAWSYAACLHNGIDPRIVFHADGYKGGSESILHNYTEGKFIGLPLLQWAGMAYDEHRAKEFNAPTYPKMIRWLRET